MKKSLFIIIGILLGISVNSAEYTYKWKGNSGKNVKASISPLKYGKRWAYSIEFDDGGAFPVTYGEALISKFKWTDAPPGVKGGKEKTFVGTCAINPFSINTPNKTSLNWQQIKDLQKKGWGFVNHSYWHTGVHWDPKKMNSPEQFRRELFWSLAIIGHKLYDSKFTTPYFVYPNGDHNYSKYLGEFAIRYGTRCHGSERNINKKNFNFYQNFPNSAG